MNATVLAAFLHLCPASSAPAGAPSATAFGADGSELRFVVNAAPGMPGCRSLALGAAQVEALQLLAPGARPTRTILLQGGDRDGRFSVSEQTLVPDGGTDTPAKPQPMSLRTNLLATMQARSYGVEERVEASLAGGRLQISCRPGSRPAGVLLTGPWTMPRLRAVLRAGFSGKGQFDWQVADAAQAARESGLDMGRIAAGGAGSARLALPAGLDRGSWRQFVIACPADGGSLRLDSLVLEPEAPAAAPRSTWIWDRSAWRERGDELLAWAARERIGELFIVVPLEEGRVQEPQALAAFVRRAGQQGVKVSAVEGDPHMVLPSQRAATAARARAYAAYNAAAEPPARLAAIQFDIEPYLLPEHVLPAARLDEEYVATLAALREAAGSMALEFVVPFWWDNRGAVLAGLARYADALTVMDYRTDPEQIQRFAVSFLDWAAAHGKRARIALEAGPLPRETQRRYQRLPDGSAGDMLLVTLEGRQLLVLLRQPLAHASAQPYQLAGTRVIDGSATTFHADKGALRALLPRLEADFGAWPGFGGIALHELR
ncbi:hypothetical protein [Massilia sp. IC2-476]|uniref:hypothetical protein n=1 Tax=Massilia sp. IC2-476 TaxID=2887199 RepID=UPI001D121E00|nr:hypothetical protein [Massilia sp. IC2-476]MCC2970317.1 hypothetical protein [Massilia sp. IC2-476]